MNRGKPNKMHGRKTWLLRALGCAATLTIIPLWICGALGDALSLGATFAFLAMLTVVLIGVPATRLPSLLRIVVVIASTNFGIMTTDYLLRVFGGSPIYYRAHTQYLRRDTLYPSLSRYEPNVDSSRMTFGDLAAISGAPTHQVPRNEIFQTDSFGFRNTPESPTPYNVVVIGDSFGMGLGVSQDEHWAALLGRDGFAVYNLSMPTTCSAHGAARLSLEIDRLKLSPGATVIAPVYTGNDIEECTKSANSMLAEGPQGEIDRLLTAIEDYRSRSPLRQLGMRLVYRFLFPDPVIEFIRHPTQSGDILFYKPHDKATRPSRSEVESTEQFRNLRDGLLRMHAIARAHNARLIVPLFPTKEEVYGWLRKDSTPWAGTDQSSGIAQAVHELCDEHHFTCLDLKPLLVEEAKKRWGQGELLWWLDDSHWNRTGHEVTKRIIVDALNQPSSNL